jgi:hypothetical protein
MISPVAFGEWVATVLRPVFEENIMVLRSTKRVSRQVLGIASAAVILAACGGGELIALLQIVTPLAGQWNNTAFDESISFVTPTPDEQVLLSKYSVTANIGSASGVCGIPLPPLNNDVVVEGTLDNGKLSLRLPGASSACIEGSFIDLRRFDAVAVGGAPARSYFNSRVDVRMNTGLWVSENGKLSLKFTGPSSVDNNSSDLGNTTGCDVSNSAAKVNFSGTMRGFVTATLTRPTIAELRNGANALLFSKVEFTDGATLKLLDATGQSLTLTRKADPVPSPGTTCP